MKFYLVSLHCRTGELMCMLNPIPSSKKVDFVWFQIPSTDSAHIHQVLSRWWWTWGTHWLCEHFLWTNTRRPATGCDLSSLPWWVVVWRLNTPSSTPWGEKHLPWTVFFKIHFITGNWSNTAFNKDHWRPVLHLINRGAMPHPFLSYFLHTWFSHQVLKKKQTFSESHSAHSDLFRGVVYHLGSLRC